MFVPRSLRAGWGRQGREVLSRLTRAGRRAPSVTQGCPKGRGPTRVLVRVVTPARARLRSHHFCAPARAPLL